MKPVLDLVRICRDNGVIVGEEEQSLLMTYVDLLMEWNRNVNLISRKDEENVWFAHILHSISVLFKVEIRQNARVADLGTGGGLPGIPLAILRKDIQVTLIDSIRKKTVAVGEMTGKLGLKNVRVLNGRMEELVGGMELGGQDVVIARAVASLKELVAWTQPLLRRVHGGGMLVAMKGGGIDDEIRQVTMKYPVLQVSVQDLVFRGSEEIGLEEKKLVIVRWPDKHHL